jgi:hypothetical protein
MARSFAEAFKVVRDISKIKVFSPNRDHLNQYVRDVSKKVDCEIVPVEIAKDVLIGSDIVATCTNAYQPVVEGKWLEEGSHFANVTAYEVGPDLFNRITVVGLFVRRTPMSAGTLIDDDFALRIDGMTYAGGTPEERAKIPPHSAKLQERGEDRKRFPNATYVDCVNWETGEAYRRSSINEIARWKTTLMVPYQATRRTVPVSRVSSSRALVAGSTSWRRNRGSDRSSPWRCFFRTSPHKRFDYP